MRRQDSPARRRCNAARAIFMNYVFGGAISLKYLRYKTGWRTIWIFPEAQLNQKSDLRAAPGCTIRS